MKSWGLGLAAGVLALLATQMATGQSAVTKVFFLEDAGHNKWCAYRSEAAWKVAVQNAFAMTVGTLRFSNGRLTEIDVTETDDTGDWMVYDNYFVDEAENVTKLSRLLNVLPSDRSVTEIYAIKDGRARKTGTTKKELSTGKLLRTPDREWLPDLPITTGTKSFPFHSLLALPGLTARAKVCAAR